MHKIQEQWSDALPSFPEAQLAEIFSAAAPKLHQVGVCFWLFRILHRLDTPAAVLMGDYCFARFSHHLAALDSVALTDAFADFLRKDTLDQKDFGAYLAFLRGLAPITDV